MKRTIALALSALLLLGALTGCGTAPAEKPTEAPAAQAQTPSNAFSADGSVIFDRDGLKVTTAGLDTDPTDADTQPIIWVDIENTHDRDAYLGVSSGSVNGIMSEVLLIDFYEEDGAYYGGDYEFQLTIPAHSSDRYALGYYGTSVPGVNTHTLQEMEFCFTLAEEEYSWPDYSSEPVRIVTGESADAADISALGKVVIDNDKLRLVIGEQDYDDWFGPEVYVYAENKTDRFIGVIADTAEADGVLGDYIYYAAAVAPGKLSAVSMSFDGELRELKGFENLTVNFKLCEADSKDALDSSAAVSLDAVSVQYPPRVWGIYENGGLSLEIQPKYNDLITVETPKDDADGILFAVSETASLAAGGHDGAGWLFSIGKVSEEKLHEMLCYDMSGTEVFAKDGDGNYYLCCHPTDVRYERATVEEMKRDQDQWTALCEWAQEVPNRLAEKNGLESASFGNSEVELYLARAAWMDGVRLTLSTTEYGPLEAAGVDAAPYAAYVLRGFFWQTDAAETPDGEYVVLSFPDEDVRLDFFFAPGAYVRVVSGENERLYQAMWSDDNISYAEAMQGWYYALAEQAGLRTPDGSLERFCGEWHEKIAGRGTIDIARCLAPGKLQIELRWPESASVEDRWSFFAAPDDNGRLVYENGERTVTEYDENGEGWITDESWEESGWFYWNDAGELCWHNNNTENGEDSVFIR